MVRSATVLLLIFACLASTQFIDAEDRVPIQGPIALVSIDTGAFQMGSGKGDRDTTPVHLVNITHKFQMGATEVTQAQYSAVMNANPSSFVGNDLPVENVRWNEAVEFCRKLTESERAKGNIPEGMEYRLPTESEWEYCCRAGTTTEFCCGDDAKLLGEFAWLDTNSDEKTHAAGTKKPNAWGLYDMHGNVWEWCLDWYAEYQPNEQTDPVGPGAGEFRVMRGGYWKLSASDSRSAVRSGASPGYRGSGCGGFRIVLASRLDLEEARKAEETRRKNAIQNWFDNAPLRLVAVPAGTFEMGAWRYLSATPHRVNISRSFYVGVTEVTQGQYRALMKANPSGFQGADLPVDRVSWNEAMEFCRKLTVAERRRGNLPEKIEYRLPTEAEWEYCCKAGSTTEYSFGDDARLLGDYGWFEDNSGKKTNPVAAKKPNPWGLYDMHGNVWEWCLDWYEEFLTDGELSDPTGPESGQARLLRGGSWNVPAGRCHSTCRFRFSPDGKYYAVGFRVVAAPLREKR
ncbi:MAG: formylglycine-generating enzyme family protein [Candidatus Brocadiia bacterium]